MNKQQIIEKHNVFCDKKYMAEDCPKKVLGSMSIRQGLAICGWCKEMFNDVYVLGIKEGRSESIGVNK